jgi:hypothetical protein
MFCAYAKHMPVLFSSYFSLIVSILQLMISICRKLSRGWNNFELMVSICRKLSRGPEKKKKRKKEKKKKRKKSSGPGSTFPTPRQL